jgi:hypothetical protein
MLLASSAPTFSKPLCKQGAIATSGLMLKFGQVTVCACNAAACRGKRYGTTAVCALVVGDVLYVAHCGDSRAVLCRDGAAAPLTRDHKPASVPEERRRIEAQGECALGRTIYSTGVVAVATKFRGVAVTAWLRVA